MNANVNSAKIAPGYNVWFHEMERAASKTLEFGTWWRLGVTYWRVAWIEATRELYAAERKPSDRFVVLTCLEKKEVADLMKKWFDGDNLEVLFRKFEIDVPQA